LDDTKTIVYTEDHPGSGRSVIAVDDGNCCWVYLTNADKQGTVCPCWVYNRIRAPHPANLALYRGRLPPAADGFTTVAAVPDGLSADQFAAEWSEDGHAILLTVAAVGRLLLSAQERQGFSEALAKPGPFGLPWNEAKADALL
jgi:hypothetical protein